MWVSRREREGTTLPTKGAARRALTAVRSTVGLRRPRIFCMILRRFMSLGLPRLVTVWACVLAALAGCAGPTVAPPAADGIALGAVGVVVPDPRPVDPARAQNVFVMLSGGVNPSSNNYSQYLQAKAVTTFLERNYPLDTVWTFFGAGNVEGKPPLLGDVRRSQERDGRTVNTWLPGTISRNRPAKREVILRAFREEILPRVRDGGTVYLFVGDHGSQRGTGDRESIIDLWTLARDATSERGWKTERGEVLGVSDLRKVLADGLGRGRVVFCMTQCHSGGFHHLAVPRELTANPRWFTRVPGWWKPMAAKGAPADVRAAGFTATDEFNLAAGCDPDPDPEKWVGYERFMPESLLGLDLFTLQPAGERRASFYEAHIEATLVDRTIDKPYSTSEQYLERWAHLIETRLAKEANLSEAVKRQVAAYQRTVDGGWKIPAADAALRERQELFGRFTQRMADENPALKNLVFGGSRAQLEAAMAPPARAGRGQAQSGPTSQAGQPAPAPAPAPTDGGGRGRGRNAPSPEVLKLWNEAVRPAWKAAVLADRVAELPVGAREFEKYLLAQEANGKDFLFANARALADEVYWKSGYADPSTLDRAKAEAVVRWGSDRRSQILAWAKASDQPTVRAAAEEITKRQPASRRGGVAADATVTAPSSPPPATNDSARPMSRKTAAERVLFYRRTLAAWAFLLALDERPALARIAELTALERTPLPSSIK